MAPPSALASLLVAGLSLIALSPQIPPDADQLCEQTGLFGQGICVMNTGVSTNRSYSSQVLLTSRQLSDNVTAVDRVFGAQPFLRPDLIVSAEWQRATFLSVSKAHANAYVDLFLCSESTCESVVDLKYLEGRQGSRGIGYPLGVVPFTNLAIGLPVGDGARSDAINVTVGLSEADRILGITNAVRSYSKQGAIPILQNSQVAVAGSRVVLETLSDFLSFEPGLGVGNRTVQGRCSLLLYPDSAWYRQYILGSFPPCTNPTQTLAITGVDEGNWCWGCDSFSISVVNYQAGCYPTNRGTCGYLDFPLLQPTVANWTLVMYNLTSPPKGKPPYSSDQSHDMHPWTPSLLLSIVEEGRAAAPVGCNRTETPQCVGGGCNINTTTRITCQRATAQSSPSGGFGALLASVEYYWASSRAESDSSFLGYERLKLNALGKVVEAAESWSFQIAGNVVKNTVLYYDQVLSTTGMVTTWLTTLIAVVGAWAAYPQISHWITNALGDIRGWQDFIGKSLAGVTTIVATSAPLVIVIVTQHSLNVNNGERTQRSYFQSLFDAPGYGNYKLVAVAEVHANASTSNSAYALGLPLLAVLLVFDIIAWVLSERVVARTNLAHQKFQTLSSMVSLSKSSNELL